MQLDPSSSANLQDARGFVERVSTVKLFHVVAGRNAWHATWSERYTDGSLHTTLSSAKEYAETKRVQGSLFEVIERPALQFQSNESSIFVTEINAKEPLSRLNLAELAKILSVLSLNTMTLQQCSRLFRASSPLWGANYPREDSAILGFKRDKVALEPITAASQFEISQSKSRGATYKLDWHERPAPFVLTTLLQVYSMLQSSMPKSKSAA